MILILVVCCICDGYCNVCSDVVESFDFCGKAKAFTKDIIPFCNGQMWPDLVFEIIQVALMFFSIFVMCCCDGASHRSCGDEDFIMIGMVVTCLIVLLDIIKIIITIVFDDKLEVAAFELFMFMLTLAISCCLHPCTRNCSYPCIPGILCLAILQVAGEVVKHMFVVHNNEEMDGTGCLFL